MPYQVSTLSVALDDQISAAAQAATDKLNALADAGDNVNQSVQRIGPSAQTLANRYDPLTKATNDVAKAQTAFAAAQDTVRLAVQNGSMTQAAANGVLDTMQGKVLAAQTALAALSQAHGVTAEGATAAGHAHAGFTVELVRLGHEAMTGEYSRIPGSMVVLAERTGNLTSILRGLGSAMLGVPGVVAGVVVGLGAMAYATEEAERRVLALQTALLATRTDAASLAPMVIAAGQNVASTSGFSSTDAVAAAQAIASAPNFQGTQQQLAALVKTAGDVATVLGVTLPVEAAKFAEAMSDPGKVAQELADKHFPGMTQALAENVKLMQASGDAAGAFGTVLNTLAAQTHGAAEASKTELQQALELLGDQFKHTGDSGRTFFGFLGDVGLGIIDFVVRGLTGLAKMLNDIWSLLSKIHGSGVFGQTTLEDLGYSTPAGPAIGSVQPNLAPFVNSAAAVNGLDPEILARLQLAEGVYRNGQWQTSSAGAVGPMQLMPGTFAGIGGGLTDINDPSQNVSAGAALFAHLLRKYGDVALAVLAYHDGETAIDQILATGQGNASDAAIAEARKVVAGYSGTGFAAAPAAAGPVAIDVGSGVVNNPQAVIDQAIKQAQAGGLPAFDAQKAAADIKLYTSALADLATQGETTGGRVALLQEALDKANKTYADAITPLQKFNAETDIQIAANENLAAAYLKGGDAVAEVEARTKAVTEAIALAGQGAQNNAALVDMLTAKYKALGVSQAAAKLAPSIANNRDQLDYINAETASLGENDAARQVMLAHLKAEQDLKRQGIPVENDTAKAYLQSVDALTAATVAYDQQKQALDGIASAFTSAFDQISQGITNSFLQGTGAAVNWGNVMKSVAQQVIGEFIKLAVLNPMLNGLFGQNNPTFGSTLAAFAGLGGGGIAVPAAAFMGAGSGGFVDVGTFTNDNAASPTSSSSGGSGFGGISNIGSFLSLGSLTDKLGLTNFGSQLSSFGQTIGLTGEGGLLSGIGNFLSTPIFTGGGGVADTAAALTPAGADFGAFDAAAGDVTSGTTIGGLLGGVGLGFGAGTLLNSLLGGHPLGGMLGSGAGAAAGALAGTFIFPGVGTLFGGLLGRARSGILAKESTHHDGFRNRLSAETPYRRRRHVGIRARSARRQATRIHHKNHSRPSPQGCRVLARDVCDHSARCDQPHAVTNAVHNRERGRGAPWHPRQDQRHICEGGRHPRLHVRWAA